MAQVLGSLFQGLRECVGMASTTQSVTLAGSRCSSSQGLLSISFHRAPYLNSHAEVPPRIGSYQGHLAECLARLAAVFFPCQRLLWLGPLFPLAWSTGGRRIRQFCRTSAVSWEMLGINTSSTESKFWYGLRIRASRYRIELKESV